MLNHNTDRQTDTEVDRQAGRLPDLRSRQLLRSASPNKEVSAIGNNMPNDVFQRGLCLIDIAEV